MSPTLSPPTPELAASPVLDELAGWVTIQSVLDTLVALKIDLALTPGTGATAALTATATVDAAIRELKGACVIAASRDLGASGAAARYFDVIKLRA